MGQNGLPVTLLVFLLTIILAVMSFIGLVMALLFRV